MSSLALSNTNGRTLLNFPSTIWLLKGNAAYLDRWDYFMKFSGELYYLYFIGCI